MALLEKLFGQPKDTKENGNYLSQNNFLNDPEYEKIRVKAIKELVTPIDTILTEIKDKVLQDEYSMLIGDDTSGRIPTLIFRGVINNMLKENEKEPLPTFFIRGDYGRLPAMDRKRLTKQIQSIPTENSKALIITDYMRSGLHIRRIGTVTHKAGAVYDVAAISRDNETIQKGFHQYESIYPRTPQSDKLPAIYNRPELSGLSRSTQEPIQYPDRKYVIQAREDTKTAINILSRKHF